MRKWVERGLDSLELLGKSREQLRAYGKELGEPAYRGDQIYHWLYGEREFAFERMSNLPGGFREKLTREATACPRWASAIRRPTGR